jgi:GntR family transcriptional regulator
VVVKDDYSSMLSAVDRSSAIPYHVQVKEVLRERIERVNLWKPGDQLPGESELCELFGVSRTVIRQALAELLHDGLIIRIKGKGTFVAEPKITEGFVQKLAGFYQDMTERGTPPVSRVLKQSVTPASAKIAAFLKLDSATPVIEIERLRFVKKEPIVLVTTYIPYSLCPELIHTDLTRQSLYAVLEKQFGLMVAHGDRSIEAVAANEREAQLLEIELRSPLILLNSVSYLEDGTPVEYYHAIHRGDRSRFTVELVRVHGQKSMLEAKESRKMDLPRSNGSGQLQHPDDENPGPSPIARFQDSEE